MELLSGRLIGNLRVINWITFRASDYVLYIMKVNIIRTVAIRLSELSVEARGNLRPRLESSPGNYAHP